MMCNVFVATSIVIVKRYVLVQNLQHFMIEISCFDAFQGEIRTIFFEATWQIKQQLVWLAGIL